MGPRPNWYDIGNKACYIPKVCTFYVKNISMLKSVKVSLRPEHNAKWEPYGI